jgi:uncharacterized protein (DUF1778 family)
LPLVGELENARYFAVHSEKYFRNEAMPKLSAEPRARKPVKRHRLEARLSNEQRELFQRAADLQDRSLTDFVIGSVHEKAVQTIESMSIIRLNAEQSLEMAQAIFNPREPSARLLAAAKRYRKAFAGR